MASHRRTLEEIEPLHVVVPKQHGDPASGDEEGNEEFWLTRKPPERRARRRLGLAHGSLGLRRRPAPPCGLGSVGILAAPTSAGSWGGLKGSRGLRAGQGGATARNCRLARNLSRLVVIY